MDGKEIPSSDASATISEYGDISELNLSTCNINASPSAHSHGRPPRVSSATARLNRIVEDGAHQSMMNISNLDASPFNQEFRRRSHSAPMSREASKVANELKRLSDALNFYYTAVKKENILRYRRNTLGERLISNRQTFHFDYDNYYEDDNPSSPTNSGTSV